MFTKAAAGAVNTRGVPGRGKGVRFGRRGSRMSGLPEVFGELPVACLAEETETPGDGQVCALVTIAGNPALSNPNGGRLAKALASLEFMVSCDIYLNETTRHSHVVLPGLSPLESPHYRNLTTDTGGRTDRERQCGRRNRRADGARDPASSARAPQRCDSLTQMRPICRDRSCPRRSRSGAWSVAPAAETIVFKQPAWLQRGTSDGHSRMRDAAPASFAARGASWRSSNRLRLLTRSARRAVGTGLCGTIPGPATIRDTQVCADASRLCAGEGSAASSPHR